MILVRTQDYEEACQHDSAYLNGVRKAGQNCEWCSIWQECKSNLSKHYMGFEELEFTVCPKHLGVSGDNDISM